jgi:photosystem II stability/assembly factor-like uncharacterized protein
MLAGHEVYHAFLDPRDGHAPRWAATDHAVWGAHVYRSDDAGTTWTAARSRAAPRDARGLEAIWFLAPDHPTEPDTIYAGIEPAGLFVSRDRGASWHGVAL